jgi:hypothetical protein
LDDEVISDRTLNEIDYNFRDLIRHSSKAPVAQLRIRGAVPSELSTMKNKADRPADEEDNDDDTQPKEDAVAYPSYSK